jgi:hypothetical protein
MIPGKGNLSRSPLTQHFFITAFNLFKNISSAIYRRKYFFLSFLLLHIQGCKEPDAVGLDVLPDSDRLDLVFTDTLTLQTKTVREDSLRTDELTLQLLGSISDPVFGQHEAAIFSQVVLEGIPSFSGAVQADSLVLSILYSGYYGDTNYQHTLNVYRLTEDLFTDSAYYSNDAFAYDPSPIATLIHAPRPNTPVVVGTDTVSARMRIRLDQALADSILALDGQQAFSSNANWVEYFKGIHLVTNPVPAGVAGNLSYLNFTGSKMILYYRDTSGTAKTYSFSLTAARSTRFNHDYSGTAVALQLSDSSANDSLCYIQSLSGVKSKVSLPFLKHLTDSGSIIINKAELEISVQASGTETYAPPAQLLLLAINEKGEPYFPDDYFEQISGYYGGAYGSGTKKYKFNIARHLQKYLDGRADNYGFYIVPSGSSIQGNRAVLGSPLNTSYPMKLNLYYTKIPR